VRPDKNATEANNTQASDSDLVDERIYPLRPSQKAETAVPEYEQIEWEAEQTKGDMKDGTPSNHLEKVVSRDFRIFSAIA
jgi:hypothetical protein